MRRFLKKQLMDYISEMLKKQEVMESIVQSEPEAMQTLLAQCQEMAIQIGDVIEKEEQPHESVIKKLEAYCELLYEQSKMTETFSLHTQLDKCLSKIKEYITEQIPEKLEVVFFPYKASMWDSLESVWKAAKKDPDCDAYVVPIPYFDKNPDGTVSAMHYEGDAMPDYVPIVDWREYDVTGRHPDIVYIHNPYDHENKVTTVHLDFYAKELKKHTDMLVYIPYFVCLDDAVPEHFCVLPGTMYADRVIVQAEKTREIYIREFHKFEEEYDCKGRFGVAEEKFVALGSPKYDKVIETTRENIEIPKDWNEKIMCPDGSRKKVLFYNTSVTQLLQGEEQILKKIRSVFEILKRREDMVLLWRPHPLSETTYAAMRPKLMEAYQEIVEEYKKEDWGIYDDTPDLHRAIALSDAYYGDMSSVVELYRLTGKPIMIQNVNV